MPPGASESGARGTQADRPGPACTGRRRRRRSRVSKSLACSGRRAAALLHPRQPFRQPPHPTGTAGDSPRRRNPWLRVHPLADMCVDFVSACAAALARRRPNPAANSSQAGPSDRDSDRRGRAPAGRGATTAIRPSPPPPSESSAAKHGEAQRRRGARASRDRARAAGPRGRVSVARDPTALPTLGAPPVPLPCLPKLFP